MVLLMKVAMSSFRSLAPSHQHDHSSGSSRTKQGAFVGESSTSGGTSGGASGSGGDSHRRRRNAGNVSLMACNECRHARQKVRLIILTDSCLPPLFKCLSMLRSVEGQVWLQLCPLCCSVTGRGPIPAEDAFNESLSVSTNLIQKPTRTTLFERLRIFEVTMRAFEWTTRAFETATAVSKQWTRHLLRLLRSWSNGTIFSKT